MEIPVINRITNFEAGINSLHNPSFISQLLALSGIEKAHQQYNIWKWGALILALLASFTTIINRIKILIIKLKHHHNSLSYQPLINNHDYDDDEDYDSDTETSCSSSDEEEEEDDDDQEEEEEQNDEDFHVRGSGHFYVDDLTFRRRRRSSSFTDLFSWSEFANGKKKSVVKLWDNLGLALENTSNCMENVFGVYDMNKEEKIMSIFGGKCQIPSVSKSSNAVIVSAAAAAAETSESGVVSLRGWDTRVACRIPAIIAEWRPKLGKIVGVNVGGVEKVYVRDDVTGELTVGDMRNVTSPLVNLTESDLDTWWDADAVIVTDEYM